MVELFANSGHPDLTPHSAASDLGLHCLLLAYGVGLVFPHDVTCLLIHVIM